jgi:uncharacterized protein YjaG (DUF416 family)
MKYKEFTLKFKSQSANLAYDRQLSLAITICKKLFFDYQMFSEENQWGNPDVLLDAIKLAEIAASENCNVAEVNNFLAKISEITPDSEDFGNASYSINACGAIYETLEFLIDRNSDHIYNIGTYLTDTIDFKIQEDNELTEDEIDSHSMMTEARSYLIDSTR